MVSALALIDCNNFYASCEQAFDPLLQGRPVVVLSNNDGCIVARSREARQLGIAMGTPYFKVANQLQSLGVAVRSSNYALYGDMSSRVMACIEARVPELEVYSVDEAFARTPALEPGALLAWGAELRVVVRQQLGLSIAVGMASSKVLAKLANRLAKVDPARAGVFRFPAAAALQPWLEVVPVEDIWGVGQRLARWCRLRGLSTAWALSQADPALVRRQWGVVGLRLQQELRGVSCLPLVQGPSPKRETCVSRSFSQPIQDLQLLRQAVASYVVRAAEKLRQQQQRTACLTVFIRTSPFQSGFYSNSATIKLALASNDTAVLLQAALPLVAQLFRNGYRFHKAGVLLQELQPLEQLQQHLFVSLSPQQQQRRECLMQLVDQLNARFGAGTLQWAATGLQPPWLMRRGHLSPGYTTRIKELPLVQAC
ncbi:MAG: Y-family DNA polymerase [Synechococcus sp. LacPavin_0920_WC12_MAG_50_7]|nr:Y-family DNA polymerase [Synechococcus sp. LacPavin_0920_WC12_MAG_50_7]